MRSYFDQFCGNVVLGLRLRKRSVVCKKSDLVVNVVKNLWRLGYIKHFIITQKAIQIFFCSTVRGFKRLSKISDRRTISYKKMKQPLSGVLLISTSLGILTSHEVVSRKLGGELLVYVY